MADDLISRQAAIEWFTQKEIEFLEKCRPSIKLSFANGIARALAKLPAVDAVEVVRCKDCIHCGFCGRDTNLEVMGFYGYCSRGERREDG